MKRTWLALLAVLFLLPSCRQKGEEARGEERAAASPPVESSDIEERSRRSPEGRRPVLWLGLDGLDWELLDRLSAEGKMPNWKRLTEEGYSARLASFLPLLSPILWTTAATGMPPDVHGVLDFQEVDPKTGRKVPISGLSRAVPAVWNLASASGRKVGVVGWWATHPAEEANGFFVSDRASPILFERQNLAGVAFPPSLEAGVGQVVARDGEVTREELSSFLGDPSGEKAAPLSRILGATRVHHRIARDLYDRNLPDLLALYIEGTDEVGHLFATSTPPKIPCASDRDLARYGRVVERYYGLIDQMLGQWMRRAAEDRATLIVHSDHGFKWGDDRPCGFASKDWSTAAFWHRQEGVFAAWGAGVRRGERRGSASLFDVAPTLLALLGILADRRMPGRPISSAFDFPIAARERAPVVTEVRRVAAEPINERQADEYAKKLLALGYLTGSETKPLAAPGGERPGWTEGAWNNLGVYLRDTAGNPGGARAAFEKSLALRPDYYSALFNLAVLERSRGAAKAAEDWFFRSLAALRADPAPAVLGWSHEYQKEGNTPAARSLLERAAHLYPENEEIARDYAILLYRAKECPKALAALSSFEATSRKTRTWNALALFQTCLGNREEVIRLLTRSLALDPNQPEVARSLAMAKGAAA